MVFVTAHYKQLPASKSLDYADQRQASHALLDIQYLEVRVSLAAMSNGRKHD
jgi:hypothetical protein